MQKEPHLGHIIGPQVTTRQGFNACDHAPQQIYPAFPVVENTIVHQIGLVSDRRRRNGTGALGKGLGQ